MRSTKTIAVAKRPSKKPSPQPAARLVRSGKVARWGNSLAFRIPQEVAERLNLTDGGRISLEVDGSSFTVRPVRRKWTEAELLQGVTPEMVGGEIDWGDPVGKEV